jgi:hypothetical protein
MATAAHPQYGNDRRRIPERRHRSVASLRHSFFGADGLRLSWGGIWGGVLMAVGLLLLLAALGVAVGISAVDPQHSDVSSFGTGAGIWAGVSLLVALFFGGMVSTRAGFITDRATGFFEGALVWVVSVLLMGYLATSGISSIAGGAFKLIGGASQAVGSVMQSAGGASSVDMSGSVDEILARLKDPKTAQQIAQVTGMPAQDVQSSLNDTAQRVDQNRNNPTQAAAEAKNGLSQLMEKAKSSGAIQQKAQEVKPAATKAAWITFGALILSLLAAVIGAMAGRRTDVEPGTL